MTGFTTRTGIILGATALALAACRRHPPGPRTSAAAATAAGEIAPAPSDSTLVPSGSPDSTGKFGAPGYGFGVGGHYAAPAPIGPTRPTRH